MERLKALAPCSSAAPRTHLHSSMERLKVRDPPRPPSGFADLHSSMERLKVRVRNVFCMRALDLHSSMERLKGFKALYLSVISKFTFQYGEIKSAGGKTYKVTYQHLHSSMERLKVLRERSKNNRIPTFTFQYGEIKRLLLLSRKPTLLKIYIPVWRD